MKKTIEDLKLNVLYEISRIIGQVLNLDQALARILAILSETLSMKRATVTLKDNETGKLMIRASHGLSETEKLRGVYRQDEGVTGHIFQSGQPLMVPDISKEPLFLDKTRSRRIEKGPISFIGVPISLHGKPIGVLNVDRLFGAEISPEEDIQFLTIVSALIAQFVSLNLQVEAREKSLKRENRSLKAELSEKYNHFFIVGTSPAMMAVQNLIEKVAPSKASILLLGESGTGKTLIARIIHEMSDRAEGPFAKLNCATLPENLLESELFGHERGAFTGATSAKPGRMEEADGGTIFMDEIGELPLSLQAKLLRFLQEREFERLGSTKTRKVDVRIIAATNRDLSKAIQEGGFREDLYYRLNVFPIQVPPLRERREDILPLIDYFSEKFSKEYVKTLRFTPEAFGVLLNYRWSGNVRELENLMERLAILIEDSHINVTDLPPELIESSRNPEGPPAEAGAASAPFASCSLEDMEKREVMAALERHNWNQSRAAKELGLTLRQVGYRLKKYNLEELVRERRTLRSRP